LSSKRPTIKNYNKYCLPPNPLPLENNDIKLRIRALILEETLLKKGFFQAIFPKLLKVFGKGFKGKTLFQKGFPLELMTSSLEKGVFSGGDYVIDAYEWSLSTSVFLDPGSP